MTFYGGATTQGKARFSPVLRTLAKAEQKAGLLCAALRLCLSLALLFLTLASGNAQSAPRLLIVQCDELRFDDLRDNAFPHLFAFAERNAVGLVNLRAPAKKVGWAQALQDVRARVLEYRRDNPADLLTRTDDPVRLWQAVEAETTPVVLVRLGDLQRLEAQRSRRAPNVYAQARSDALRRVNIFFYLLESHRQDASEQWNVLLVAFGEESGARRLAPLVAAGPDFPPGLLTSATTRTLGLVANLDLAPTLFQRSQRKSSLPLNGRPIRAAPTPENGSARLAHLAELEYVATLNDRALTRAMIPLGATCAMLVMTALALHHRRSRWARWFTPGLVFTLNLPTAALFAPILPPPTLLEYGLRYVAWMFALTVVCYALGRWLRQRPSLLAAALCLLALCADLCTGQRLLKYALLSDYPLAGIRYYGIGNEYLGVALGFALMGGFLWIEEKRNRAQRWALALGWGLLAFLLGYPGLGANAGSLIVTGAGFGVGLAILWGRKATPLLALACMAGGLALAFAFGALETRLSGEGTSHIGASMQAASGGRGAFYLVQIALRKVGMNLSLLATIPFWLAAAAVGGTLWLAWRLLGAEIQAVLLRRPWLQKGLPALYAAGIASLLFKDSGVVTALFLAGGSALLLLYEVREETALSDASVPRPETRRDSG